MSQNIVMGPSWDVGFDESWGFSFIYGIATRGVQSIYSSYFRFILFYVENVNINQY